MQWTQDLLEYNAQKRQEPSYQPTTENDVFSKLRGLYQEEKPSKPADTSSYRHIPQFYFQSNQSDSEVKMRARKESRTRSLEKKAEALLDEEELEHLWQVIQRHQSQPRSRGERINYDAFCYIANEMPPKAQSYFRPTVFLKFARDLHNRISARSFFHYVVRKVSLAQLRISLTCYDELGLGYLREQDLENYIFEQIPSLPQLNGLEADFYPYYVFTAVRKFIFFLDPLKKGRMSIRDIVSSPLLREFNELRLHAAPDEDLDRDWFTSRAALKIYATYLNLDIDHNGMLNKEEFARYSAGTLTPVFVDRIFQECRMYRTEKGSLEMDYKTFLDFVLAMRYKDTPQSLQYFWRILDVNKCGYLTAETIQYFFKAVVKKLVESGNDAVKIEDVTNEIFDMVRPALPDRITLQDLIRSNVGHTVVGILTDLNGFWQYDNREAIMANDNNNEGDQ